MFSSFFAATPVDYWDDIRKKPGAFINEINLHSFIQGIQDYIDKNGTEQPAYPSFYYYLNYPINQPYAVQVSAIIKPLVEVLTPKLTPVYEVPSAIGKAKLIGAVIPLLQPLLTLYRENVAHRSKTVAGHIDKLFENTLGISARDITDKQFEDRINFFTKTFNLKLEETKVDASEAKPQARPLEEGPTLFPKIDESKPEEAKSPVDAREPEAPKSPGLKL